MRIRSIHGFKYRQSWLLTRCNEPWAIGRLPIDNDRACARHLLRLSVSGRLRCILLVLVVGAQATFQSHLILHYLSFARMEVS